MSLTTAVGTLWFGLDYDKPGERAVASASSVAASIDKKLHVMRNADHYGFVYEPDGSFAGRNWDGANMARSWIEERFPL